MNHNTIIKKLCQAGFPSYLVGGAVRDIFDNKTPNDYDIVTKATPSEIEEVFKGEKVDTVGKSFGVTIVNGYEIATFRVDHYPEGNGAKNCTPKFAENIHDDLGRRDFTINALALCPFSGDLIDNHDGLGDLRNRVIRFVGDPNERISEDPNRIVRSCRFIAKVEGTFDIDTLFALRRNANLVQSKVDPERIMKEVMKAMELDNPSIFFAALHTIGALDYVFPGMSKCVNHTHGNHHIESVWDHLMVVGDSISPRFPVVRLAGFLHDIGKPLVFNEEDGTFIGHEHVGASVVDKWLKRLKFSNEVRNNVTNLIRLHMIGAYGESSSKAIRKFRKTLADHNVSPQDWLRVRLADRKGNLNKHPFTFGQIRERRDVFVDKFEPLPFTVNSLALKGGQLIELFNLTPGKVVGQLQRHLLNFVIEEGGEFNTPEALAVEAKNFLNNI